jgi:hypothetical protein
MALFGKTAKQWREKIQIKREIINIFPLPTEVLVVCLLAIVFLY